MIFDRRLFAHFDWRLFCITLAIPCLGLIVLYSAGHNPEGDQVAFSWLPIKVYSPAAVKQIIFICLGLVVMLVGMMIPTQFYYRYSYIFYAICVIALLIVMEFGVVSKGARRWFSLGSYHIQPAEAMKIGLILTMARFLSSNPPKPGGYTLKDCVPAFLIFMIPMGLIMKQPDLGTSLIVGGVGILMVLFIGIRVKILIFVALASIAVAILGWSHLHDYQKRRVEVLFNPDADPLGSGYHIIQSKIAVGSGEVFGKGYLKGTQTQLQFLPEHTTDFIFSVLAEEWGFVGCLIVLFMFLLLLYTLLEISAKSNNFFGSLVVFGVAAYLFIHMTVNVGMVIGLLPVVGIPLPLFSYGGSSALTTMFLLGLVQGIHMRRSMFHGS